jgi:RNA ligase
MVQLKDLFDIATLHDHIRDGYVTKRFHDSLPLAILNYTPQAQYAWKWDEVTLKCRGLIYNIETGEVVARPFEKFFNWDQGVGAETWQNPMPPPGPAIRMPKMDGSLGVLYPFYDKFGINYAISTRGSFHSEQAEWASKFFQNYIEDLAIMDVKTEFFFDPKPNKTYLFEIIYPENRIVVDYGDYKGLMLIDVIDNETGEADLQEYDDCAWHDKAPRTILFNGFDSGQAAEIPDGDEGFVYLWPSKNFRTKMKSAEYIELHKLISHLSEKSVWEQLVAGKTAAQIKAGLPDEFYGFVDRVVEDIQYAASGIVLAVSREMMALGETFGDEYSKPQDVPRKDFANAIKDNPYKKYLFLMLDGKPIYPVALADSKPKTNKALVSTEDI